MSPPFIGAAVSSYMKTRGRLSGKRGTRTLQHRKAGCSLRRDPAILIGADKGIAFFVQFVRATLD